MASYYDRAVRLSILSHQPYPEGRDWDRAVYAWLQDVGLMDKVPAPQRTGDDGAHLNIEGDLIARVVGQYLKQE